jgi:serine/threonine protein kinase
MHDDENGKIYLITELCGRGPVMKYDDFADEFSISDAFVNEQKKKFNYSEEELRDIIRGIILGLDYLHDNNIIHRDIKPDNILMNEHGSCKITDFNVSAMLDDKSSDKVGKKVEGTMNFMAPECCSGKKNILTYTIIKFIRRGKGFCRQAFRHLGTWSYSFYFNL